MSFRVARLIVYEAETEAQLHEQLGRSLNDGRRTFATANSARKTSMTISVTTLPAMFLTLLERAGEDMSTQKIASGNPGEEE